MLPVSIPRVIKPLPRGCCRAHGVPPLAQVVLRKSANKDAIAKRVEDTIVEFANRGYRALGVARADGGEGVRHALCLSMPSCSVRRCS